MGYRSDVVALMYGRENTPENIAMIKEFIRQRVPPNIFESECFEFNEWGVKFEAEQWKWYDSYADIQMLEKLFAEYKEAFCEGGYDSLYAFEFVRVGESYDDIETDEAGHSLGRLSVDRSIRIE